jgi:hypothetical protein
MSPPPLTHTQYADHGGDGRSSTEVGEPLMGRGYDKSWRAENRERKTWAGSVRDALDAWRRFVDTILLLVIVGLLLFRWRHGQDRLQFQTNGDLTGFVPQSIHPYRPLLQI